jgi:hypothetical protein
MTKRQLRKLEMFSRVRDFFNQYAADFPPASIGGNLFAALLAIVAQLEQLSAETISAKGEVGQMIDVKGDAKDKLQDLLEDIVDMARTMAYEIAGLEDKFRMPRNMGVVRLVATGRAFAADAAEYRVQFIAYGLPTTFIDDLTAATDTLEAAYQETDIDTQTRVGKIAALVPLFADGMTNVKRLDPIVRRHFRGNPQAFAAWTFATHLERDPRSTPQTPPS